MTWKYLQGTKNYKKWHCRFKEQSNRCSRNKYAITKIKTVIGIFSSSLGINERDLWTGRHKSRMTHNEQKNERMGRRVGKRHGG